MPDYQRNHYVPEWLQRRFLPSDLKDKKFYYLDLNPNTVVCNKHKYVAKAIHRWGPSSCFFEKDLYTTRFGNWSSTEIERKFFGRIDLLGRDAVSYFSEFEHPSAKEGAFNNLLLYMSTQKMRTPKGLTNLAALLGVADMNNLLIKMQQLRQVHCALWTECIWSIADASKSETKFILSDHPVTVYNRSCPPHSKWCLSYRDPDIAFSGTHTLFPLSLDKILIFTNLSWIRDPYSHPRQPRPNPNPFRSAMFNFMHVQTRRYLSDAEVNEINYVIKKRAYRYVAAAKKEWLFPEGKVPNQDWAQLGQGHLFMPDPRSVSFSSEIIIGYGGGKADLFDEYGRRPWQKDYKDEARHKKEWDTSLAYKGEFSRLFGPKRRGLSFEHGQLDKEEDSPDYHAYHLDLEEKFKPKDRFVY